MKKARPCAEFMYKAGLLHSRKVIGGMKNLEILIWMITAVVVVSLIMGIYSTNKHYKIKEQEIKLEQERLELEKKKI